MQRISARVALAGGLLFAVAAFAVLLMSVVGGNSGVSAAGPTPTNTPGPAPTPKSTDHTGEVDGIFDIVVDTDLPAVDLFHCISYLAHDGTTDDIKVAVQCHDNTGAAGDPNAEPLNDAPGEGPSGDLGGVGPPPPPPYNATAPSKGVGTFNPGTDDFTLEACIPEVAGPLGPNIIAIVTAGSPVADMAAGNDIEASVLIYGNQTDANCDALTESGTPPAPILTALYPAFDDARCGGSDCEQSPYRPVADSDFDNDGCTDLRELDKDIAGCGDDPWNPHDTSLLSTDVAGDYTLLATAADADCNPALTGSPTACEMPGDSVPGIYYSCVVNIAQAGKNLTAKLGCYIDSAALTVNPQASIPANATNCGPAAASYCGDGQPGSPPPGITAGGSVRTFSDVDTAHPTFLGVVDNAKGAIVISGCFPDLDGFSALDDVHATATVDMNTGHGWVLIRTGITSQADCLDGPPFADGIEGYVPVDLVRQSTTVKRDSDSDKCADRKELGNSQGAGGLRDPSNHYDYLNPTKDGLNRVDDILAVVNEYFNDDPPLSVDYKSQTDRTAIAGGNAWNLGPPNGQQRVDDILAAVKQYFHDCNLT